MNHWLKPTCDERSCFSSHPFVSFVCRRLYSLPSVLTDSVLIEEGRQTGASGCAYESRVVNILRLLSGGITWEPLGPSKVVPLKELYPEV